MFENLNIKGSIWRSIKYWLRQKHPELIQKYEEVYFSKSDYWHKVEEEIKQFCKKQKIDCRVYFHHRRK